jgi:hypothetical protein
MTSRFSFDKEIPPSREVVLNLPGDVPVGPAILEVTVTHPPGKKAR